jgi:ATP-dependent helicase HrpA
VFLPGEREIRDTADALAKRTSATPRSSRSTPGSPPPSSSACSRRTRGPPVVLATNVAETSLTVPGIRYVDRPGLARISRYSRRLKVQRLPIEKISQASANQRAGAAAASPTASASASTPRTTSTPAPRSPTRDPAHQPRVGRCCR